MELTIKARPRHLQLTPHLRAHVEERFSKALAGVAPAGPVHVEVAMRHQLHSARGAHQSCRVVLTRPHAQPLELRAVDKDMYQAIDRLQRRLNRVLRHHSDRQGRPAQRRQPLGRLGAGPVGRRPAPSWLHEEAAFLGSRRPLA